MSDSPWEAALGRVLTSPSAVASSTAVGHAEAATRRYDAGQKVILALLTLLAATAAAVGLRLLITPVWVPVVRQVPASAVTRLVAQLDSDGVAYRLVDAGTGIAVPASVAPAETWRLRGLLAMRRVTATSVAATASDDAPQSVLDQLLGSGHAVVRVSRQPPGRTGWVSSEQYSADPGRRVVLRRSAARTTYGMSPAAAAVAAPCSPTVPAGSYCSSADAADYGVNRTVTTAALDPSDPMTVSVVVDRAAHPDLPTVRALVSAAVGLDPRRGDRLTVVLASFASPVSVGPTPARGLLGSPQLLRQAESALAGLGLLVVLAGLGRTVRAAGANG